MTPHTRFLLVLLSCYSFSMFNFSVAHSSTSEQKNTNLEQHSTAGTISGKVTEFFDSAGYTYAEIDTGENKVWAAGPVTALKTGDMIAIPTRMPMKNFRSKSLQRDFPVIYFVDHFITDKQTSSVNTTASTSANNHKTQQPAKDIKAFDKVKDGKTIAEIYSDRNILKGKTIRVRGQVTKYTPNILGKNWLHIMDNSTSNDLTITTDSKVSVDDIVIVEGQLELDRDFGYGYVYSLIIENARIE